MPGAVRHAGLAERVTERMDAERERELGVLLATEIRALLQRIG